MSNQRTESLINTEALFFASKVTPAAIERVRDTLAPSIEELAKKIAAQKETRLFMVGGGASLAAMMGAQYLLDRYTDVKSDVMTGWQFLARAPYACDRNSIVFVISYSGETPEVLEAKKLASERGATVVAITNTQETPLAQGASLVLDYQSKAVYTAPLAIVYLLAAQIMKIRDQNAEVGRHIIEELGRLPGKVDELVTSTREPARELAASFSDAGGFYVLGSGPLFGLAYKLSLSVVIENLWIDAAPVDTGEFYHGPIEIIPPAGESKLRMPILHMIGTDATRTVSERARRFCTKHNAAQLVFDAKDYPEFGELFSPFALFVPTEWFVMYMAAQKDHDVDERRFMGKIGSHWGDYGDVA
jgi:fructoselysine 6-phosphate deglycase